MPQGGLRRGDTHILRRGIFRNEGFMPHAVDRLAHFDGPLADAALAGCIVGDAAEELIDLPTPMRCS
jgi:hypothetical protein